MASRSGTWDARSGAAGLAAPTLPKDDGYGWRAALVCVMGMFIVILDSSIVNVALPHMMSAFGANLEEIEWVSTGYMLSSAVMMPTTGFLGDRFGRKKVYLTCIALFTLVSMLCGASWNTGSLIGFRILQGVAGGAIMPIGQAIMFEAFPPEKRGISMGLVGIGGMLAPILGPTLGGYLVDALNWRWIFYVNLPVGLLATSLGLALLREGRTHPVKFDAIGFSLMASALTTCLLAVSNGNRYGWSSDYILELFALSVVTFCGFLVTVLWRRQPIVNLRLYRHSVYTAGTITGVVVGVGLFGGVFLVPVFLQNVMGFDAWTTGLIMAPGGLVAGMGMPLSGAMMNRVPPRLQLSAGMLLMAASMFLQSQMTAKTPVFDIIWWTALRSLGMSLSFPVMNQNALGAVPMPQVGQASGLLNVTRQVGGSFAIAGLTTFLTQRVAFHLAVLGARAHGALVNGLMSSVLPKIMAHGASMLTAQKLAGAIFGQYAIKQAMVLGYQDCFFAAGIVSLLGIIPALFVERRTGAHAGPGATGPKVAPVAVMAD